MKCKMVSYCNITVICISLVTNEAAITGHSYFTFHEIPVHAFFYFFSVVYSFIIGSLYILDTNYL